MERYYQPEIETASREQIKAWQDERLVKQVKHVWDNVPYYRKKMEAKGLPPEYRELLLEDAIVETCVMAAINGRCSECVQSA